MIKLIMNHTVFRLQEVETKSIKTLKQKEAGGIGAIYATGKQEKKEIYELRDR